MILKLNKNYMPCGGTSRIEDVFVKLCNGSYIPIEATLDENGDIDVYYPHTWESWLEKEIPEGAEVIRTVNRRIEIPTIIVCTKYDKIPKIDAGAPSKEKIYERDDYTCVYTGKRLSRKELSIDHVYPTSRGPCPCGCGVSSCWNNMVTCSKDINHIKSNHLLGEMPQSVLNKMGLESLELRYQPFKPKQRKLGMALSPLQKKALGIS